MEIKRWTRWRWVRPGQGQIVTTSIYTLVRRMPEDIESLSYMLDAQDRIVDVSPNWDAFALANDGDQACASTVLNRSLMDFVHGAEVQMLLKGLFMNARVRQKALTVPFRCDAPDRRRYMSVTITPLSGNGIVIRTRLVRELLRDPVPVLDINAPRNDTRLRVCAWCNRIYSGNCWLEIDEGISKLGLFHGAPMPLLNHTICPDCNAEVEGSLSGN